MCEKHGLFAMKKTIISLHLTDVFNQLNIQILENGLFRGDRSWFYNDVISDFNRLYFIIDGRGFLEDKTGKYPLLPGKLYLIPAGTQYTYRCPDFVEKFYIHFQLPLFPGKDLFDGVETFLSMDYSPEFLEKLLGGLNQGSLCGLLAFKSTLTDLIRQFLQIYEQDIPSYLSQTITGYHSQEAVIRYVEKHLSNRLKISEIAAFLNRPYHEVSRDFFRDTRIGLKAYIDRLLLQKAKYLLLTTDRTISEIAEELNFSDAYYFSRFFKKFETVPPKEYRKRHEDHS